MFQAVSMRTLGNWGADVTLVELSDPRAVESALDEYDSRGRGALPAR
jgi:hypothetical protein